MLSLLLLIEQSHGTTFVMTVGDKKGEGSYWKSWKGSNPMLQAHSSKRPKREGAGTEDVWYGLGHDKLLILRQILAKEVHRMHYIKVWHTSQTKQKSEAEKHKTEIKVNVKK